MKGNSNDKIVELMCAAIDIKDKMRNLYEGAAAKCSDDVGKSTFKMLEELEQEHLTRLEKLHAELAGGTAVFDSCRLYDFGTADRKEIMRRIRQQGTSVSNACRDDIAAIETGMDLENKSIEFFIGKLRQASTPSEREFLNYLISEERAHYITLADLKFYYIDPEHWLMELGRTELDGAGASS